MKTEPIDLVMFAGKDAVVAFPLTKHQARHR
jgi:hypothetical protein